MYGSITIHVRRVLYCNAQKKFLTGATYTKRTDNFKLVAISEGIEILGSLSTQSALLDSFLIFARMNFAMGCTNGDDAGTQLVKTSMNIEDFGNFSMTCSKIS